MHVKGDRIEICCEGDRKGEVEGEGEEMLVNGEWAIEGDFSPGDCKIQVCVGDEIEVLFGHWIHRRARFVLVCEELWVLELVLE